jgi:prepilin-type N-terminal cleavage/methylation domain-containing protein
MATTKNLGAQAGMPIFRAAIFRKISGFTLIELTIVILLVSIFLTFASVSWNVAPKKGSDTLLEDFSAGLSLAREEAIAGYEVRVIEFNISENKISVGLLDEKGVLFGADQISLAEDFRLTDVVINGQSFPVGKCYMTLYSTGMTDRAVIHMEGEGGFYSLLVNPLTAKVTGEKGYFEEVAVGVRNESS